MLSASDVGYQKGPLQATYPTSRSCVSAYEICFSSFLSSYHASSCSGEMPVHVELLRFFMMRQVLNLFLRMHWHALYSEPPVDLGSFKFTLTRAAQHPSVRVRTCRTTDLGNRRLLRHRTLPISLEPLKVMVKRTGSVVDGI